MYNDGEVRDADGNRLGKIYENGQVVDSDGNLLGRMNGNSKNAPAPFFFKND